MPPFPPRNVTASHSVDDRSIISVTWQPLTLVEAKGFIEYIVQLYIVSSVKRQDGLTQQVPMNQSSVDFTGLDTTSNYEATVGTISLSGDATGPGTHYT